jgi:biuret amidohydrolase
VSEALESAGVDVLVDFTSVVAVKDNVWTAVQAGVHVVIGSSGLTSEDYEGPTVWHAVDLGFIPVVVTDACGGRDRPAMQRVLDDIPFAEDALLTDIATITPLLSSPPGR